MKKIFYLSTFFIGMLLTFTSCKKDTVAAQKQLVSQFVYDGLSTYYYWADEMKDKKPASNTDPKTYFKSVLNATDKEQKWSFITDNVEALLAGFAGEPKDFGYSLDFIKPETQYFAFIKYVYPNSPASVAGLKRLDIIGLIDGQPITSENYMKLYGESTITITTYKLENSQFVRSKDITITPAIVKTDPVFYTNTYKIGEKTIGYLFYTEFISRYNNSLYDAFLQFQRAGVTDLVVDLRYNHGGSTLAAIYLASLIAPKNDVGQKAPFYSMNYNTFVNSLFKTENVSRTDSLGYFAASDKDPLTANLNLTNVYIIATDDSYSASELTTFCLEQFMDVIHIGGNTGGKYTASWTIHPYEKTIHGHDVLPLYSASKLSAQQKALLKNWAMQPIVAIYTNAKGKDFSTQGYLVPDYPLKEGFGDMENLVQIGDTKDVLLGQALYLISGNESYKPGQPINKRVKVKSDIHPTLKLSNPNDRIKESVVIENIKINPKRLQKILDAGIYE